MIINDLITERFTFNNWVRDTRGYWNSVSKVIIAEKYPSLVVLTVEEKDSDIVNINNKKLCNSILENLETVDNEGDNFKTEMLLESYGGNSIPFTLMFFNKV